MLQRLMLFLALACVATFAQAQDFQAGRDYQLIETAQPTASPDRIEVVEVFGYSCIHCARAAPAIARWKQTLPADVQLSYMPAVFGGVWEAYARAFYTAQTMGVLDRTHDLLFEELHTKRREIRNLDDIAAFYAEHGVDKQAFLSTMTSFAVNAKIEQATQQVSAFGVEATPTMVVNGKYRVLAPGGDDSFARMLEIVDFLVAKERAANKS